MIKPKKGEMSINMIIMVVIALIILVILIFIIVKSSNSANQGTSCGLRGGICKQGCTKEIIPANGETFACNPGETCCSPTG